MCFEFCRPYSPFYIYPAKVTGTPPPLEIFGFLQLDQRAAHGKNKPGGNSAAAEKKYSKAITKSPAKNMK